MNAPTELGYCRLHENQILSGVTGYIGTMSISGDRVRVDWPNGAVGHWSASDRGEWSEVNHRRLRRFYLKHMTLGENQIRINGCVVTAQIDTGTTGGMVMLHFTGEPDYFVPWRPDRNTGNLEVDALAAQVWGAEIGRRLEREIEIFSFRVNGLKQVAAIPFPRVIVNLVA